jgi:hypothetical protein
MAALVPTQVTIAGAVDLLVAASGGGDSFPNDGHMFFDVNNASGSPITVTFVTPALVQGIAIADPGISVPAGLRRKIGPFQPDLFNDATGSVAVTYSGVTTLTVGVYRL